MNKLKVCFDREERPLSINEAVTFDGAALAFYVNEQDAIFDPVDWGTQEPELYQELKVIVHPPFCCAVGDTFSSTCMFGTEEVYVTARLLELLSRKNNEAHVRIQITEIRNRFSFLQPMSERETAEYLSQNDYCYQTTPCDLINILRKNETEFSLFYQDGDIDLEDYLYTDQHGIDHLIRSDYHFFEENIGFAGDKVLGAHKNFDNWLKKELSHVYTRKVFFHDLIPKKNLKDATK